MDVDRYLHGMVERLLDEISSSLHQLEGHGDPGVPMTSLEVWRRVERFTGTLDALQAMGEIPDGEVGFWRQRLTGQLEDRGLWSTRTVRHEASASGSVGAVRMAPSAAPDPDEARPEPAGPAELRAVVPVAQRLVGRPGLHVTVVSVELWPDGFTLRWVITGFRDEDGSDHEVTGKARSSALRRRHEARQQVAGPDLWSVTDDIGGRYRFSGGGSHGSGPRMTGELVFQPAVPATATSLTVAYSGIEPAAAVTVPLPADR